MFDVVKIVIYEQLYRENLLLANICVICVKNRFRMAVLSGFCYCVD
jgi:hypothetical protein